MNTWGSFESVKEIAQSGLGFLWSARPKNAVVQGETYIIKTTEGLALLGDHERLDRESQLFLEAADAQSKLNDAGAKHWVKLHEFGKTDAGAFYVADMYGRSAQKFIARGIRLDARSLSTLIHAVVDALLELRTILGRPHGNIKPSNVLVGGPDGPTIDDAPVLLTDPKPGSTLSHHDATEDLHAVGRLIYELVTIRPLRDRIGVTVSMSDEWSRLGPSAIAWMDLCNLLMGGVPGRPLPDLEEVRTMVPSAASAGSGRSKKGLFAGAAVLLAAAAVGGYVAMRPPPAPAEVKKVEPPLALRELDEQWPNFILDWQWFQPSQRAELRKLLAALRAESRAVPETLLAALDQDGPFVSPQESAGDARNALTFDDLRKKFPSIRFAELSEKERAAWQNALSAAVRATNTARDEMTKALRPDLLEAASVSWAERGWKNAAATLAAALDTAKKFDPAKRAGGLLPKPLPLAEAIDASLQVASVTAAGARLGALHATMAAEPALADFTGLVTREGARVDAAASPTTVIPALLAEFARLEAAGKQAADLVTSKERDFASFRASAEYRGLAASAQTLTPENLSAWTTLLKRDEYRILSRAELDQLESRRSALAERTTKLQALLAKAEQRKRKFLPDNPPDKVRETLAALAADITAAGKGVVLSKASRPPVDAAFDSIASRLDQLVSAKIVPAGRAETVEELRTLAAKTTFDSQALRDRWTALVETVAKTPQDRFEDETDVLYESWLPALEAAAAPAFLPALAIPPDPLDVSAVRRLDLDRRETTLAKVAQGLTRDQLLQAPAVTQAVADHRAWAAAVDSALASAVRAAQLLDEGYAPGAGGETDPAARFAAATAMPELAPIVAPVRLRLDAIQTIATQPDPAMTLAALDKLAPKQAIERLTAWKRLAAAPWSPADPAAAASALARMGALAAANAAALRDSGLSEERQRALGADFHAANVQIWTTHVVWTLRLPGEAERFSAFENAWKNAASLNATLTDADAIGPAAGYNARAMIAREQVAKVTPAMTPAEQAAAIGTQYDAINAYAARTGLANQPQVKDFLEKFQRGTTPDAGKSFSAEDAGPLTSPAVADMNWKGQDVGDIVIYTAGIHTITFLPLSAGDDEVLLSTREVSAALVRDVFKALKLVPDTTWKNNNTQPLLPMPSADSDVRAGPRVWTSRDGKTIVSPARPNIPREWLGWLAGNTTLEAGKNFQWLPPGAQLTPPSLDLPMQQFTPEAAILVARNLGCRLPTPAEWAAAQASPLHDAVANIRDQSWKALRDPYVAQIEAHNKEPQNRNNQINPQYPSGGIYLPPEKLNGFTAATDAEADAATDPWVFFRKHDTPAAADRKFLDLLGNVAEFVVTGKAAMDEIPRSCDVDRAFEFFAAAPGGAYANLAVIGGSAISPPAGPFAYDVSKPQPVDSNVRAGYSDVGFRLAITKDGFKGPPVARANRALDRNLKLLPMN